MSKIQAVLAVTAFGTMSAFAIGALMISPSPVEANVAIASNTGVSCADCHSDVSDPATSALTSLGIAYRDCLYSSVPGQPNCNIQIQSWQGTGASRGPQSTALPPSDYGSHQPNDASSESQSDSNGNLVNGLGGLQSSDPSNSSPQDSEGVDSPAPESSEDRAYVPPAQTEPPLPQLPPTPVLLQQDYPDCREDHLHLPDPHDKAKNINQCTTLLDNYYSEVLVEYRKRMNEHQDEISRIYTEKVAGKMEYSAASRDRFYKEMRQEHANSDPDGENMAVYRAAEQLYQSDRNYLSDRYCYNTGCGGYPVPENYGFMNLEESDSKSSKSSKSSQSSKSSKGAGNAGGDKSCKKSRGRGQLLGGIFGGVVGSVAGLDNVGKLIAGAAGAVLVGEIACKLSQEEQEKAAEATYAVVEQEKVGAVANWQSPTRGGVSGSSTITALNTEPNGRKCLSITDVAIIDGEETRVAKKMCRGAGQSQYTIMA